ncbi:MAG: hypothetical protein ACFB02_18240 [Mastigocoleus sp.]
MHSSKRMIMYYDNMSILGLTSKDIIASCEKVYLMSSDNTFINKIWRFLTNNPVMASVTAFIFITIVLVTFEPWITQLLKFLGIPKPSPNIVILISFIIFSLFFLPFIYIIEIVKEQKKLKAKVEILREQEKKIIKENCILQQENITLEKNINNLKSQLTFFKDHEKIGLSKIWDNYESAKKEIQEKILNIDTIKEIRILIHCEADLIDTSSGVIGYTLAKLAQRSPKKQPDLIKILKPSPNNPYYTDPDYGLKERAKKRKSDNHNINHWSIEKYINTRVERFKTKTERLNNGIEKMIFDGLLNVEVREHDQPYLWNLIIIDNWVFVQGDVYKNCLSNAPILLFCNFKSERVLTKNYYYTFAKYFDYMWKYNSQEKIFS